MPTIPKEVIQLAQQLSEATLYLNTENWYIKTPKEYLPCNISTSNKYFTSFIDLKGDRCITCGYVERSVSEWYQEHYQK